MSEQSPSHRQRRTSITKLQRQTAVGAELIELCETVTEDGHLLDHEVSAIRQWLDENRSADLPAINFLLPTVERILADGRVTTEEREELYRAIETVLPADIRQSVRGTRLAAEHAAQERERLEQKTVKDAEKEAKSRNRPVDSWDFMVAGVRYEGRPMVIDKFAMPGDTTFLIRDRNNVYSRNAIEVRLSNGMNVGYVPEKHAVEIAPLLDTRYKHHAYIKKMLTGGRTPIPVVVTSLYLPQAERPDAVLEEQVPAAQRPTFFDGPSVSSRGKRGCLSVLLIIGSLICAVAFAIVAT
jgi:hypothetical protein